VGFRGNKYLDLAGSAAVNLSGTVFPKSLPRWPSRRANSNSSHQPVHNSIAEEYAEELLAFSGKHFEGGAVCFTCGGSESVETALKLARQYQVEIGQTQRYQILSRHQSYHGSTLGALSVSRNKRRRNVSANGARVPHIGMPIATAAHSIAPTDATTAGNSTRPSSSEQSRPQTARPPVLSLNR
jgi:adenosylmethionine-8-amino-7-oxononanoate aminotransferase